MTADGPEHVPNASKYEARCPDDAGVTQETTRKEIVCKVSAAPARDQHVAVVGAGRWGSNYIRILERLGVLHTICDASQDSLNKFSHLTGVHLDTNLDRVLQHPSIDSVTITVPPERAAAVATLALKAGKAVLLEKPFGLDLQQAKLLAGLAQEQQRLLMVGHIMRHHGAIRKVVELVHQGAIGQVSHIRYVGTGVGAFFSKCGVMQDLAVHGISIAIALCHDQLPKTVSASRNIVPVVNLDEADTTNLELGFPEGEQASIYVSRVSPVKQRTLTVIGTEGSLVFDDLKPVGQQLLRSFSADFALAHNHNQPLVYMLKLSFSIVTVFFAFAS